MKTGIMKTGILCCAEAGKIMAMGGDTWGGVCGRARDWQGSLTEALYPAVISLAMVRRVLNSPLFQDAVRTRSYLSTRFLLC